MPEPGKRDRFGFEETSNPLSAALGRLVPQWLARRAVEVRVTTDRERYAPGDPVEITVELRNRLPVPLTVATPRRRLWGWAVDGELEASDERRRESDAPGAISFRARERKRIRRLWDGRFKRVGDPTRWEQADAGDHEIEAFLALEGDRPADSTTIRFE